MRQLGRFFRPESIAIVGASRNPEKVGRVILQNLLDAGYRGRVYPVNPNAESVEGLRCYKNVAEIPEIVDLCVVAVPAEASLNVVVDCGRKRVKNIVMVTAGFSESGNKRIENELLEIVKKNKMNLVGPNCLGLLDLHAGVDLLFLPRSKLQRPKSGGIAFVSQSGAVGSAVLDAFSGETFGFSKFVSYGNAVDVNETDLLEFLEHDDETKVVCMYIEGVKSKRFIEVAKRVSRKKAIIALKGGVTEAGRQAAISHTASLAGAGEVYAGIFRQCRIVQAETLEELFDFARTIEVCRKPAGRRVQIITNGGGFGILTADGLAVNGVELAKMSKVTERRLKENLPADYTVGNPIDVTGSGTDADYLFAIEQCLQDKNVDIILADLLFQTPLLHERVVDRLIELNKRSEKPILVVSLGSEFTEELKEKLETAGIICFSYPSEAAAVIRALCEYDLPS